MIPKVSERIAASPTKNPIFHTRLKVSIIATMSVHVVWLGSVRNHEETKERATPAPCTLHPH